MLLYTGFEFLTITLSHFTRSPPKNLVALMEHVVQKQASRHRQQQGHVPSQQVPGKMQFSVYWCHTVDITGVHRGCEMRSSFLLELVS